MKGCRSFLKAAIWLLAGIAFSSCPAGVCAEAVDEITYEQAQQVADNFQMLRKSLDQGKGEIEKLQQKLERIKQHKDWLKNPEHGRKLQQALDAVEASGLSARLQASHDALDTISRSADQINNQVEQIKGHYDKVTEFYDRWHPEQDNPVRTLQLVANGLEELESVIQDIDPSPDNILTKPILAVISYYRQASEAFAGALTRIQARIEERRQHCIGTGCENYSKKATAFTAKFPAVGPAWLYRPLQAGEIWYDGGGRAFLWWHDKWEELQGGVNRFEEVYHGWQLAHGQIISTDNLLARVNSHYDQVIAAGRRAARYWIMINSPSTCHGNLFTSLKQRGVDRDRILDEAGNDHDTFIARYKFLQGARGSIDKLIDAFNNTLLVRGIIVDDSGNALEGARISANSPAGKVSGVSGAGGWFSLQFKLSPDETSRQNAAVSVSHKDYQPAESQQRLWQKCEDWRITLKRSDESGDRQAAAEMQSIRDTALARATEIDGLCRTMRIDSEQISGMLDDAAGNTENKLPPAAQSTFDAQIQDLARRAGELARESDSLAKMLADSSKSLSGRVGTVCEQSGRLQSAAFDGRQRLYREIKSVQEQAQRDLSIMRTDFPKLDTLATLADSIKSRADVLRRELSRPQAQPQNSNAQSLQAVRLRLSRAQETGAAATAGLQELQTLRTRAAYIIHQQSGGPGLPGLESSFSEITAARDRAGACVQAVNARLNALAGHIGESASMTGGNTVETDDSPVPAEAASRLDQITKLADEAVNNAAIAGRFFSLAEMEQKIGEGQACLVRAEALLQQQDAGPSLAAALNSCHLDRAERIIAGGNADPQLVQRYEALRRMKQTYGSQFTRMQDLYRECRFDQAASVLAEAYRQLPPECDTARSEAARAFTSVKATADKSRSAERAYAEADNYYRQGDYANSYRRLQQARQDAACTTQITRIDNGLKQVAEKLHTAGNTPAQVNTGTGTENPVCLRYQQQLTALGNRQQQLAAQSQRISTAEQAKALQTTLMQNSRQFVTVMDQARAAGCHDVDLPPEVRQSLGMPAAASAGNGLQCKPPRVAGVSKKTGQPACMCPGELMWSKKSHQCLTFGQLINENGAMDKLDKALESTKHMSDTATGVPTMNRNSDLPDLRK